MNEHTLRSLAPDDLPERARWLTNPSTQAGMPLEGDFSLTETQAWHSRVKDDPSRLDLALDYQDQVVAMGGITHIESKSRAELYAFVSPEGRGLGHGRSLVLGLCSVAFATLDLHRLYLWTYSTNIAAQRLYAGCGFRLEGQLRDHAEVEGIFVDRVVMGQLASEWQPPEPEIGPMVSQLLLGPPPPKGPVI